MAGPGDDDPGTEPAGTKRLGPLSAGGEPRWLNLATIQGTLLVAAGASIVASPTRTDLWSIALAVLLLSWAVLDALRQVLARRVGPLRLAQAAVLGVAGIVLLLPLELDITLVLGVALVLRGSFDAVRAVRLGPGRRSDGIQAAVLELLLGAMALILPETVALGVRAVVGTAAMLGGLVLVGAGLRADTDEEVAAIDAESASRVTRQWLRRQRIPTEREAELCDALYFEQPGRAAKLMSFWVMMVLATAIASFAIIQDSTAVVIGAMLVAPLMTPIMGAAAATVNGWLGRFAGSMALSAAAVAVAVVVAWLIAAWLPSVGDLATNAQIASRVEPSLLDLCIAVAAGAAGAYATVDPRVSSSLSGVAVAVALVPPLAVVGITVQAGSWDDAGGAFLLFGTNFVSILLAGALVFALTGFARVPGTPEQQGHARRVLRSALITAVLIAVPLSLTSEEIWTSATEQGEVEQVVGDWLGESDLRSTVRLDDEDVVVVLEGIGEVPDTAALDRQVGAVLDRPYVLDVRLVPAEQIYQGGGPGGSG